jgi:hypothetical protein
LTGVSIAKFPGKGWLRRVPSGLKERNVPTEREKERRKVEARLGSARAKRHLKWLRFNTTHRNTSHAEFRRAVLTTPKVGPDRNGTDNRSSHMVGNEHHFPRSDPRILGAVEVCDSLHGPVMERNPCRGSGGRIAVYGDSSCLDAWGKTSSTFCFDLLKAMVAFAARGERSRIFFRDVDRISAATGFVDPTARASVMRIPSSELKKYSNTARENGHYPGETCRWWTGHGNGKSRNQGERGAS